MKMQVKMENEKNIEFLSSLSVTAQMKFATEAERDAWLMEQQENRITAEFQIYSSSAWATQDEHLQKFSLKA